MAKITISPYALILAGALQECGWSLSQVARELRIERSSLAYALKERKTLIPPERMALELSVAITTRIHHAARAAIAKELRRISDELLATPPPESPVVIENSPAAHRST